MPKRLPASFPLFSLVIVCGTALYVLHAAAILYTAYSGHDQAWYLIAAGRVLGGARLYGPYVSDTNPPLIVWFSMLPVLLSHTLPLSATVCLRLIVLLLLLGSACWCLRILWRATLPWQGTSCVLVVLCILYVGLRVPPTDFGQRENLFVLLSLPYLFAAGTGVAKNLSKAERCALGIAAGLAICFKPQQMLALLAAEAMLAIYRRTLRRLSSPEFLMMIFTGGAYAFAVRLITPAYTREVVPLLLDTYWAYGTSSVVSLLLGIKLRLLAALVLFGIGLFAMRSHPFALTAATFAAASVGASVAYAQQRTDWPYHRAPASAFLILAAGLLAIAALEKSLQRWDRYTVGSTAAVLSVSLAVLAGLVFSPRQFARKPLERSEVYRSLKEQGKKGTVYIFSTTVGWVADAFDLGWNWGGRFPCIAFFPAMIRDEQGGVDAGRPFKYLDSSTQARISSIQRSEVAEDLDHFQPSVVMVEQCGQGHDCQALEERTVHTLDWFLKDPRFVKAWSHYKRQPDRLPSFDVYRRIN